MSISIAIVDDKQINRNSLYEKISAAQDINVLFTASDGKNFLDKMKSITDGNYPQAVLMDIEMPIMDGIETVSHASEIYTDTRFLMLTVFDDDDKIFEAIKAGAGGYLLKDEKTEYIINALHDLVEIGGAPMSPRIARKALNMLAGRTTANNPKKYEPADSQLSDREIEILKLLVDGHDYRVIADKLFLSPHTIRKHIANIYAKLHVCSRVQAVKIALKKNWFSF
jgi:DNA-binding NarL/FixJ family response regulator